MFRGVMIVVLLGVVVALSACGGQAAPNQLQLTKQDNGKTVDLAKGGTLKVTLEGNPTTGYLWGLLSGNDAVLKPQGDYTFKTDNPNLVGAGGKFTFEFQAVGTGTAQLQFSNARPWETGVPPVETFTVTVNVK
jgi:predicted secreted protein